MPIIGKSTGFDYTSRWGIDIGQGSPIQMGARPPSHQDWELMSAAEKAAFGLPDWETYQRYQKAYETRSAPGGDIYQEKARAAELLLQAKPQTWEQARQILIQNGYDPSVQANGPLFKELEAMWNGGGFRAGHDYVQSPGGGLNALAAWLPGLGHGLALEEWFRRGVSSMEGQDPTTGIWWNTRPDGTVEYFSSTGVPLQGNQVPGNVLAMSQMGGGGYGSGGYGGGLASLTGGGAPDAELAQQTHLDTLMQQFMYEKAAREYGEAIPLENFMTDLYGDIMGVDFEKPEFSLQNYIQQGMAGVGRGDSFGGFYGGLYDPNLYRPVYTGGSPPSSPGSPQNPDNRFRMGDEVAAQGGVSAMYVDEERTGPTDPETGRPTSPAGSPEHIPGGNLSPLAQQQLATVLAKQRGTALGPGGGGSAGYLPPVPFPTIEGKGYSLKEGSAMDLADQRTWGLLAPEINREVEDMDNLVKRYEAEAPMGGERSANIAEIVRNLGGSISGIRQNLMGQAMSGISGLAGAKKGYNPAGYSGSGQALLSSSDTRRGQDIQNQQFQDDLAFQRKSAGAQLKAQRQQSRQAMWGNLLGTIGGLAGGLISPGGLLNKRGGK